jgi:nicotinate-nucleotide pyrophosphorylase (carboxylating)
MNYSLQTLIGLAIAEDLDGGIDITSVATIPPQQVSIAHFVTRAPGVIAGIPAAVAVLEHLGIFDITVPITCAHEVEPGTVILQARGRTLDLLLAERTTLNFLTHLSGIATLTRTWVDAVSHTTCVIRDTRKTTPGLRQLEKEAVRMGGGSNHRMSLSVLNAFTLVRAAYPDSSIEVEVDNLDQLHEVLPGNPDVILLDNMTPQLCAQAVAIVNGRARLEASGGITLSNAAAYAETGVDYLAIGALTHPAKALDIGLDLGMEE